MRGRPPGLFEGSPVRRSPGKGLPEARGARTAGRRVRQRASARGGLPHWPWPVPVGSGGAVLPFRGCRARPCQASSERQGCAEAQEFALRGRCHVRRDPAPAGGVGAAGRTVARRVRAGVPGGPTVALLVLAPVRQRPDPFAPYRPARPGGVPFVPSCRCAANEMREGPTRFGNLTVLPERARISRSAGAGHGTVKWLRGLMLGEGVISRQAAEPRDFPTGRKPSGSRCRVPRENGPPGVPRRLARTAARAPPGVPPPPGGARAPRVHKGRDVDAEGGRAGWEWPSAR